MFKNAKKAILLLADGTIFEGYSFGAEGECIGEIVFSTSMTGYEETLTNPSNFGQIVTQTFPLIGNYGVNSYDFESDKCYLSGYIVREWCEFPSNFRSEITIDDFLKNQNVIGLYGIDTRALTRIIRETGVMNGVITNNLDFNKDEMLKKINNFKVIDSIKSVSIKKHKIYEANKEINEKYEVVLIDYGTKFNIRRELVKRGCNVTVVPYNTTADDIKKLNPDGIMLSNGPGDPEENQELIDNLKEIIKLNIPIFGVCIGHQLLALASGAKTYKLKYGHRGENQPVLDLEEKRIFITSQNHGYCVDKTTIDPKIGKLSHKNVNDDSCEGIEYTAFKGFSVQFHPEACGGPQDTEFLFDKFIKLIKENKKDGER